MIKMEKTEEGFTLMEVLIVLILLVVVAGFALVISMDSFRSNNFRSEQSLLIGLLQRARSQAMANINQKNHGVHIDQPPPVGTTCALSNSPFQYIVFQGNDYATRDINLDLVFCGNKGDSASGLTEVIFAQLTGKPNATGSISLNDGIHSVFNVCINSEGQINAKASCP